MFAASWTYDRAHAQAWGDCGLAVFSATGIITPSIAGSVLADCQSALGDWRSDGLVASYRDADMRIDPDRLLGHALEVVADGGRLALPTALVVKRDDLPMWRTYADLMARAGILRGVFTDYDQALRWARTQAAVYAADSR